MAHRQARPDFETIADFRRDNAEAIKAACRRFVGPCRGFGLLGSSVVALDGSRFEAVNIASRANAHEKRLSIR